MSINQPPPPELALTDMIRFVESHRPYLDSGDYIFTIDQVLETGKGGQSFTAPAINATVKGDRLSLSDDKIHDVFPPNGSRGPYGHVVPHIILNRSSLPWERTPQGDGTPDQYVPSWLALLVLTGVDAKSVKPKTIRVDQLNAPGALFENPGAGIDQGFRAEVSQKPSDQVQVIEMPWARLQALLPRYHDLPALTHVRHVSHGGDGAQDFGVIPAEGKDDPVHPETAARRPKGAELAVVVGNRLPAQGQDCTVHLISLENRFRPPTPAALSGAAGKLRKAIRVTDKDLADCLWAAVAARDAAEAAAKANPDIRCKNPQMGLEFRGRKTPMLRLIQDRDAPLANPPTPVPNAKELDPERIDQLCRNILLGWDADWESYMQDMGAATFLAPFKGPHGRYGMVEAKFEPQGLARRTWESRALASMFPKEAGEATDIELTSADEVALVDFAKHKGFAVWINAQAAIRLRGVYDRVHDLLASVRKEKVMPAFPNRLGLMMDQSKDLLTLLSDHLKPNAPGCDQVMAALTTTPLTMVLAANGIATAVTLTRSGEKVQALLTGVQPLYTGRFRLLGEEPVFDVFNRPPTTATAPGVEAVRLVTLKSWSFHNEDKTHGFKAELFDLNADPIQPGNRDSEVIHLETSAAFQIPLPPPQAKAGTEAAAIEAEAARYIQSGAVALRHGLRGGGRTLSWYHGPFLTDAARPPNLPLPVSGPDALLVLNKTLGMFDVSYAAAWELGRLLTLQDNDFAQTLFEWKRDHARTLGHLRQRMDYDFLPVHHQPKPSDPPEKLSAGFERLTRLETVPFNYLVPDEAMLPVNSIRFFTVDPMWLAALRDGAFSIGRVLAKDHLDQTALSEDIATPPPLSGFLLRSRLVSDFQHATVEGYTDIIRDDPELARAPYVNAPKMKLERMARLGRNVLLCLFSDPERSGRRVEMVDIHQPAEVLHFGLELSAQDNGKDHHGPGLIKVLRDPRNGEGLQRWTIFEGKDKGDPGHEITPLTVDMMRIAGASDDLVARVDAHKRLAVAGDPDNLLAALARATPPVTAAMLAASAATKTPDVTQSLICSLCPVWNHKQVVKAIPKRGDVKDNVLDMTALLHEIGDKMAESYPPGHRFSGADLALQMLDLPPKVRFIRQPPNLRGVAP